MYTLDSLCRQQVRGRLISCKLITNIWVGGGPAVHTFHKDKYQPESSATCGVGAGAGGGGGGNNVEQSIHNPYKFLNIY